MNKQIITAGIDPGKDGAVVALADGCLAIYRRIAPVANVGKKGKVKMVYDEPAMWEIVVGLAQMGCAFVALERQQAFPKQGATSNFSTGDGYGLWRMALTASRVPFEVVHPKTWTKALFSGVPGDGKNRNLLAAGRLLPKVNLIADIEAGRATDRSKKDHDGIADAALLALWAYRQHVGRG